MTALSEQDCFVFYQLPNSNEIFFLKGEKWKTIDLQSDLLFNGFIISNSDKSSTYLLEGKTTSISSKFHITPPSFINQKELNKNEYLNKAADFIFACKNGLKKVILSRIKKQSKNESKDPWDTFLNICNTYNHSFNYLLNIPTLGMWMGASPETLITGNNKEYKTISLAGTKTLFENNNWMQKEIEEQKFVTDYIAQKLNSHNISNHYNPTPETVSAGNLSHLKTTFDIYTDKPPLQVANLLHPTPAVCGLPQKEALEFIQKKEGYNRSFYTGFLGPVDNKNCNLFVNLRCMQVFKSEYWLYVGGGITASSVPEKEWEETELKAQTLLDILD